MDLALGLSLSQCLLICFRSFMPQEIEKEINMEFAKSHRTKEEISDLQALVILKHKFFPVSF